MAPAPRRDNPFTRSKAGVAGFVFLVAMLLACLGSLPYTLSAPSGGSVPRYNDGVVAAGRLPPSWAGVIISPNDSQVQRLNALVPQEDREAIALRHGVSADEVVQQTEGPAARELRELWPRSAMGTDVLGRSMLLRSLTGGGISLSIGLAAAFLSVCIGTLYGAIAGYVGGRVDAVMMRIVDVLYGLPYILLVVLLAVASDAALDEYLSRQKERAVWVQMQAAELAPQFNLPQTRDGGAALLARDSALDDRLQEEGLAAVPPRRISQSTRTTLGLATLLIAIAGVSWLTMARVIRGQVLSLKNQPFIEAARALGLPVHRIFLRHLMPNLVGPVVVYATLTVPQAILQESFLSFLGIGVRPPLPSWGSLAADGLQQLNPYRSDWWMLVFPCLLLGATLLALNFVGEGLREALDPKRARR